MSVRVGTAGWAVPVTFELACGRHDSRLERYARAFSCTEINSTFYRPHRESSYRRWAASVPSTFLFSVKLRRTITHERRLVGCSELVSAFLSETEALGTKRGAVLVQLPPSLAFDAATAAAFFRDMRRKNAEAIACEPRHASWFSGAADALLQEYAVSRVATDPAPLPRAAQPGGDRAFQYYRWHGSPRMYWSSYEPEWLVARRRDIASARVPTWCIFDNTAAGAAFDNARALSASTTDTVVE